MRKLYALFIAVLFIFASHVHAQTITIGTGTSASSGSDNSGPIYRSSGTSTFNFSRHDMLYTAADLSALPVGATITEVAWYKTTAFTLSAGSSATFNILMKNSSATSLSSQTWSAASTGATTVYTGTLTASDIPAVAGWVTFTLTTPFVYTGGSIEILTDWAVTGTSPFSTGAFQWRYTASSNTQAIGTSDDAALSGTTSLASSYSRLMNLQLTYTPPAACSGTPNPGSTLSSATTVCAGSNFNLTVQNPTVGTGVTYQWQSSTDGTTFTDISGATSSAIITSLSANTYYQVVVTCSGQSATSTPVLVSLFISPNATVEQFNTYPPNDCWSEAQGTLGAPSTLSGTSSGWLLDDFANITSPVNDAANLSMTGSTTDEWMITPTFDLGSGGNMQMEFDLALTTNGGTASTTLPVDDKFVVLISTDNGATWTSANTLRLWDASTPISNTGEHIVIDLAAYSGLVKFAFYGESSVSNTTVEIFVDNLQVRETPNCLEPSNPVASNITNSNADISWTAPGTPPASYEIYHSTSNTPPTAGTTPTYTGITTTTHTITGLTGNTTYYVWVRSECGGSTSAWSTANATFLTLCDPITVPSTPETFTVFLPNVCWKESAGILGAPTTFSSTTASNWLQDDFGNVTSPVNDAARLNIWTTTTDEWLITPSYDLGTGGNLQLEFDLALTINGSTAPATLGPDDKFAVLISTDNGATWTSANTLRLWNASTPISNTGEHVSISLASYTGIVKFAFYGESTLSNADNDVFVDNVAVRTIPACAAPGAITFSSVTHNSATANWTVPTPAPASYDIYISTTNTAPTGGTAPTASGLTTTSYSMTSLSGNTNYYVWVRSNCGGAGISEWSVLPGVLTTECDPIPAPTASPETFTTYLPSVCWKEAQGVLGAPTTFTSTISSSWTGDDFANITSPVNDAANLSISGTLADEWLITPSYDLGTGGNLQLEFDLALTGNGNTDAASLDVDDKFIVLISTDNGATWSSANILRQWNNSTPISNTGEHIVINLSAYTGVVKFAFYGESTITNTTIEVFVDNVEIKTIPSCASPASVTISNVTNNSATADWTAPVPAPTSYDLYFSTSSTDPTSGTTPTATGLTATTYNLTGLTGNTSYYVWVRSNCSGTLSSWTSLAAQFTTDCDIVSTFTENFDGVTAPALPNCWEKVGTSGSVQTQTTGNNTPPNTLYIYSSTTSNIAMVSMPKINNLGAGTHWLKFDIRANFTANGIIEIGYLTTPGDQSSFVLIDTVKAGSTTTYSERTVMPGVISTSSQLLAFRHTGSPANSILIDNVRWEAMPACTGAVGGTATASAITYCDSGTPTITASGFSIGAISSYQWQSSSDNTTWTDIPGATDPSGFVPASALTATTYYRLKVTCTSGTATDYSNTVTITINPRPTVTVSAASNNICGGGSGTTLTASGANTYTWSPTTGLTPTTGAVVTANPTSNTSYTVTGTETATGCTNTATVAITVAPTINLTATATPATICEGASSQLQAVSSIAYKASHYQFTAGTGATLDPMTGATTVVGASIDDTPMALSGSTAGPAQDIGFDFVYEGLVYNKYSASPDGWLRLGPTTASSQFTNSLTSTTNTPKLAPYWDDIATGTTGSVKTLLTGSAPNRIFITEWNVTIPRATTGAANSTFQLWLYETSGKIEFRYGTMGTPNGTSNISSGIVGATAANFNSITFSSNTASNTIANNSNNIAPASGTIYTFEYTQPTITYLWSPAAGLSATNISNPVATPTATTVYTVTATESGNSCAKSENVTVTVNPLPTITLGANPSVCTGATSVDLAFTTTTGSPDQYSINFDAAAEAAGFVDVANATLPTSPIVITVPGAAAAATYNGTITVRNNTTGCNGTASVPFTITVNANVTAGTVTGSTPLVAGATAQFSSNGTTGGTWSSTNTAVATVDPATGMVTAVAAGTTDITYTVNSGCGSPVSSLLTLTVTPATTAGIVSGTSPLCIGQVATYTTTGTTGGTWSSTNTAVATVNATTGEVTAVAAGTTDITYTISGNSSFMTLTVSPNVSAGTITGTTPLCIGSPVTFTSNGTAGGSWSSSNTAVAIVNASTGEVTGVAAGTADITYTVSSGCGSPVSTFISITVDPNVSAGTITGSATLCTGSTSTFTTNGTAGGTWSSTNTAIATVNASTGEVTAIAAGTTDITYTVSSGCGSPASTTLAVTVNLAANAGTVTGTSSLCVGATSALSSNGDAGGTWSSSNTAVATVDANTGLVTAVAAGSADIIYTVSTGCGSPVTAQLTVNVNAGSSWTGATSTDWNTASNWCGGVPTATSDVTIAAGAPNMPTISAVANVRNMTIATGATVTITAAGRLNIHGNYENDGTMDASAGTVAFQGATAQTADALVVANLVMNGAGGVTLNGNLTITGALTLTNGHITTGDHTVTINQGASGSLASHIITSGNGTVVANNVGATAYSIPVSADAAGYNPITLTNGQGLNYTVKVATGIFPTILNPAIAINRTWGIVPSGTPATPVTIALEYQDGQANASANPTANMEVGVHNGTNWTVISQPGGIAPTGPATARMVTVQSTQMGAFVLSNVGGTTAVPVIDQDITSIQLMPNVVNGRSTLRVNVRRATKIDWVVTDMNGRQVSRFTQQLMPGQTDLSLQFGNLPNGSYLLSGYTNKGKTEVLRFVKL